MRQAADQANQNFETASGLYYAVQCFEEAPLNTVELKERMRRPYRAVLVDGGLFNDPGVCDGMHSFRADEAHTAAVASAIPALIVTGEFDPQTHRSNGPILQRTIKNSLLVEVPGAGHSGMFDHACTRALVKGFLDAPLQRPDSGCLRSIPSLEFITVVKEISR